MRAIYRLASAGGLLLPILLTGCSLFPTTRKLPVPKAPLITRTVTPEDLVAQLNRRWEALNTLTAKVEMRVSQFKPKQGVATDSTTIPGVILIRKPEMLRVYGRVPVFGTRMFDMVGDGKNFAMYIPSRKKEYKGSYTVGKKSASLVESMRPGFFFDSLAVRGLEPNDLYQVTADTITVEDAAKKHLFTVPEYVLNISRGKPGGQALTPERVIYFHRDDLQPYRQDVYDREGNLETQVTYAGYRDFGSGIYPSTITIKRPLDEFQILLSIESVTENKMLKDDQFVINDIPDETQIQNLE